METTPDALREEQPQADDGTGAQGKRRHQWQPLLGLSLEIGIVFVLFDLVYRWSVRQPGWWRQSLFRERGFVIESPGWLLPDLLCTLLLLPLLRVVFAGWRLPQLGLRGVGFSASLREGVVLLGAALLLVNLSLLCWPEIPAMAFRAYGITRTADLWVYLLWVIPVMAGVGEELFFRGVVHGGLSEANRSWGPLTAAVLFAGVHYFQGLVPLLLFHLPISLLFMLNYRRNGNLLGLMLVHTLFDWIVFSEFYLVFRAGHHRVGIAAGLLVLSLLLLLFARRQLVRVGEALRAWSRELGREWRGGVPLLLAFTLVMGLVAQFTTPYNPLMLRWDARPVLLGLLTLLVVARVALWRLRVSCA